MKIIPISNPNIVRNYQTAKQAAQKPAVSGGQDEVTFSSEALGFSKVMAEIETRSAEERAHIAEISGAVDRGEYKIDSGLVADRIIEAVLRR